MGKKKKRKKNKLKGQILAASQSYARENHPAGSQLNTPTAGLNPANPVNSVINPSITPNSGSATSAAASHVIAHINTDLRFFFIVTIMMAVVLAGIYIWDQQSGIILQLGQKLYQWFQLS